MHGKAVRDPLLLCFAGSFFKFGLMLGGEGRGAGRRTGALSPLVNSDCALPAKLLL